MRVDVPEYNTYIDFPDGTSPQEIKAVLDAKFPPQSSAVQSQAGDTSLQNNIPAPAKLPQRQPVSYGTGQDQPLAPEVSLGLTRQIPSFSAPPEPDLKDKVIDKIRSFLPVEVQNKIQQKKDFKAITNAQIQLEQMLNPPPKLPDEASWKELLIKAPIDAFYSFNQGASGLVQAGIDVLDPARKALYVDKFNKIPQGVSPEKSNLGAEAYNYWSNQLQQNAPALNPGSFKSSAYSAITSIANNLPFFIASVASGKPFLGLGGMAAQTAGQKYPELIKAGVPPEKAKYFAAGHGIAEGLGETFTMLELMNPEYGLLKRVLFSTLADIPGEVLTTAIQKGIDYGTIRPDMTWNEFKTALKETAKVTALSGPLQAGVLHPIVKGVSKLSTPRPTHDTLQGAGVTGKDSIDLQTKAPNVKPVVKMTVKESNAIKNSLDKGKTLFVNTETDTAYVIDNNAVHSLIKGNTVSESVDIAKKKLVAGGDAESELLGYPKKENIPSEQTIDIAVNKQGEIITDLEQMKQETEDNNIAWAAAGKPDEIQAKAEKVSEAIKGTKKTQSKQETSTATYADKGGYSQEVPFEGGMEMPEVVELAKDINEGKAASIKKQIGRKINTLGQFDPAKGTIELRGDIFLGEMIDRSILKRGSTAENIKAAQEKMRQELEKDPRYKDETIVFKTDRNKKTGKMIVTAYRKDPNYAIKTLAHEIGHLIDWLPDKYLKRGNILGRIASLKKYRKHLLEAYPGSPDKILTKKDKARLRREAERILNATEEKIIEIEEEIKKEVPLTPDEILSVWRDVEAREKNPKLVDYISRLSDLEKKLIMKAALKGKVESWVDFKNIVIEKKKVKKTVKGDVSREAILKKYHDLIREEIKKRGLYELSVMTDELKKVSQAWKPFDEKADSGYTKYRYSSVELYADALSVLINNPAFLKKEAPTFTKAFFAFLDKKSNVKDIYNELIDRAKDRGEIVSKRIQNLEKGVEESNKLVNYFNDKVRKFNERSKKDVVLEGLLNRYHEGLKFARLDEAGKKNAVSKLRSLFSELPYVAAEIDNYVENTLRQAIYPLEEKGANTTNLTAYQIMLRTAYEKGRQGIANPLGHNNISAKEILDGEAGFVKAWGKEKYNAIKNADKKIKQIRKELVLPRIMEGNTASDDLLNYMNQNIDFYTKYNIAEWMEKKLGKDGAARFFYQYGTLKAPSDTVASTLLQDMSVLRTAIVNETKIELTESMKRAQELQDKGLLEGFEKGFEKIIVPAEMEYSQDIKGMIPVPPERSSKLSLEARNSGVYDIFTIQKKEKFEHYYVSKYITDMFKKDPYKAGGWAKIWSAIHRLPRDMYVGLNPKWMIFNVPKDALDTMKNLPDFKSAKDVKIFLEFYKEAYSEVWNEVMSKEKFPQIGGLRILDELNEKFPGVNFKKLKALWARMPDRSFSSKDIQEMKRSRALLVDRAYSVKEKSFDSEIEQISEFVLKETLNAERAKKADKLLVELYEFMHANARVSELTGKVAGFKFLKYKRLKPSMTPAEKKEAMRLIGFDVRTSVATPDPKDKGKWNSFMNNMFLFSLMRQNGLKMSYRAAKRDPAGYAFKTIAYDIMPKMFVKAMKMGLLGGTGGFLWNMTKGISDYHISKTFVIPFLSTDDDEQDSAYLTFPQGHGGQLAGELASALMDGKFTGRGSVTDVLIDAVPYNPSNLSPYISKLIIDQWLYYVKDINPVDPYSGYNVIPRGEYAIREQDPSPARRAMLKDLYRAFGPTFLWKPKYDSLKKKEKLIKKALRFFPFNVFPGTFLHVSNRGLADKYDEVVDIVRGQKRLKSYQKGQKVKSAINDKKEFTVLLDDLIKDGLIVSRQQVRAAVAQFNKKVGLTSADPRVRAFSKANSKDEKRALLEQFKKEMPKSQYDNLLKKLPVR